MTETTGSAADVAKGAVFLKWRIAEISAELAVGGERVVGQFGFLTYFVTKQKIQTDPLLGKSDLADHLSLIGEPLRGMKMEAWGSIPDFLE